MTDDAPRALDHERLLAALKEDDPAAIGQAYGRVFGSEIGRLVLTHLLAHAGVGTPRTVRLQPDERAYHDGRADHALWILEQAGYGQMSAAHLVAADTLEGQDHDGRDATGGSATAGSAADGSDAGQEGFGGPDLHPE